MCERVTELDPDRVELRVNDDDRVELRVNDEDRVELRVEAEKERLSDVVPEGVVDTDEKPAV